MTRDHLPLPPLAPRAAGSLLGAMAGDALGLPREGLSPRRATALHGAEPRHRLVAGRGMISDDGEHALMTAWCVARVAGSPGPRAGGAEEDAARFGRLLAARLRGWIAAVPAGVGFATARACVRLWLGWPPDRSGVMSAGNGPAMRAPILGALLRSDAARRGAFVAASTRLTHRDPRALHGALIVAEAAAWSARRRGDGSDFDRDELLAHLRRVGPAGALDAPPWLAAVERSLARDWDAGRVLAELGCPRGVGGFIDHTVPAVLAAWLRSPGDLAGGMRRVFELGGDADTTGAILGGLGGALVGEEGLPRAWVEGLCDWPWTAGFARRVGAGAAAAVAPTENGAGEGARLPGWPCWPLRAARNAAFLAVVLAQGARRALPPW